MAARRLLIIMLVLLAISTVLALVMPSRSQRTADSSSSTSTSETTPQPDPTLTPKTTGKVVNAHLDLVPKETKKKDTKKKDTIEVHRGDQLILSVTGSIGDDIEIPRFGLTETVTPYAPAVFNLIVDEAGTFPVRAVAADLVVGRIVATDPSHASPSRADRRQADRPARGEGPPPSHFRAEPRAIRATTRDVTNKLPRIAW